MQNSEIMHDLPGDIRLKEGSWLAQLAAWKMGWHRVALVLGNTIHLHNITRIEFGMDRRLMNHELKHVEQYRRLGLARFLILYGWYTLRFGYYNNPLEVEARLAENGEIT